VHKAGGKIVGFMPDTAEDVKAMVERTGVKFAMLADPDAAVAEAFGVRHAQAVPGKDLARPAVLFVRADGTVAGSFQPDNYRRTVTAEELRAGFAGAVTSP
jgi:peroxiredoxin